MVKNERKGMKNVRSQSKSLVMLRIFCDYFLDNNAQSQNWLQVSGKNCLV